MPTFPYGTRQGVQASGTPAFSPHDLRHRRATLWHLDRVPVAEAAGRLGHSPQEHLRTYAHVVLDRTEVDYERLVNRAKVQFLTPA